MSKSTTRSLAGIPVHQRADLRVTWKDGMRPTTFPHTFGTVFLSKGSVTVVRWDGQTSLSHIATGALAAVR